MAKRARNFRLDEELTDRVIVRAKEIGVSLTDAVEQGMALWLDAAAPVTSTAGDGDLRAAAESGADPSPRRDLDRGVVPRGSTLKPQDLRDGRAAPSGSKPERMPATSGNRRTAPRTAAPVSQPIDDCHHPTNRRIGGDYCAVCNKTVPKKAAK